MASHRVIRSLLVATGVLLIAACASQSASTSLDDKYFEREAQKFVKVERNGETLYCQKVRHVASLVPYNQCINEDGLRERVENARRARNTVPPPVVAGTGQGGIG